MPGLSDRLMAAGYGLGWSVVCRLPESWAAWAFRVSADIAWRRQGPRVQVLEGNLRRVLGPDATGAELRALSRESMQFYARYWLETFRLPVIPLQRLVSQTFVAPGHLEEAMDCLRAGRGVIFALPHMGNYDHAGAWIVQHGAGSLTTVQERLKPESLFDKFAAFREGLGFEVLPASGGVVSSFGILSERLRAGKLVCLVADRDVTGSGTEVDYFGEKARIMGGSAALAERTGAALFPVILWYEGDCWGIYVDKEIRVPPEGARKQKVARMTQELAHAFEAGIRAHPADWHMLQRVFVADLDPERLAAAEAKAAAQPEPSGWAGGPGGADRSGTAGAGEGAGGPGRADGTAGGGGSASAGGRAG
jgi:phosphatidylinositol dimannoside acyltransferase